MRRPGQPRARHDDGASAGPPAPAPVIIVFDDDDQDDAIDAAITAADGHAWPQPAAHAEAVLPEAKPQHTIARIPFRLQRAAAALQNAALRPQLPAPQKPTAVEPLEGKAYVDTETGTEHVQVNGSLTRNDWPAMVEQHSLIPRLMAYAETREKLGALQAEGLAPDELVSRRMSLAEDLRALKDSKKKKKKPRR